MATTKTDKEVLNESTAVAKRAAKMIGGSFEEAEGFTPTPQPLVQDGAVDAEQVKAPVSVDTPEPMADAEAETFQAGLQSEVDNARTNLESTLKQERDMALKRQEQLNQKLQELMKENDPENRETIEQEKRIIQNQLDAAETASEALEKDFNKRRATVSELDRLLTEGNQLIEQKKNQPIQLSVLNKSVNRIIQDVHARAGVLQAVISGLDGNIAQAHNLINIAQGTVRAYWKDQQNYNQAYMKLVEAGQLAKNKIQNDYAQSQIALAENKLNQLEETSNYLKELMIDPQSSQFIADAGVTLNDSVEEINNKMAEQSLKVEINDTINELKMDGYEYVPFAGDRTDVVQLEVGGKTLSFVPPVEETQGDFQLRSVGGSLYRVNPATGEAELVVGGGTGGSVSSKKNIIDLTPTQERSLVNVGFNADEINQIQSDVSEFGLDAVLEGIDDENQKKTISEIYGREIKSTPATPEEVQTKIVNTLQGIKAIYTRSEAEDLARARLEESLGTDTLPQSFENALQEALVEVYGATILQNIVPGGRGNFPFTPE